jgi:glycosyltransferase involved in cell wall biosynthesis
MERAGIEKQLRQAGIACSSVNRLPQRPLNSLSCWPAGNAADSDRIRIALEILHTRHRFDLIEFSDSKGMGFRSVQAKRARLAFQDVPLMVKLQEPSQYTWDKTHHWLTGVEDLFTDFGERLAFEQADLQVSASSVLLDFVRQRGWKVGPDAAVVSLAQSQATRKNGSESLRVHASPESVLKFYAECLKKKSSLITAPSLTASNNPKVSLAVTHFNLGQYLPDTLASLARQRYPNLEVLVVDDGSTDTFSVGVYEEQSRLYPQFRFLRKTNGGVASARNFALAQAQGEFFIVVDGDDIVHPQMVEHFVAAMLANPDLSFMTCFVLRFERRASGICFTDLYAPTGGPYLIAPFANALGWATGIFRSKALRSVGGYDEDPKNGSEDCHVLIKLIGAGFQNGVVPEVLLYYRSRPDSRSRSVDVGAAQEFILKEYVQLSQLPPAERSVLWRTVAGLFQNKPLRYRLADEGYKLLRFLPFVREPARQLILWGATAWKKGRQRRQTKKAA